MSKNYRAADIEVLSGLEPVRRRPGMYTDTARPNHLAHEVVDPVRGPVQDPVQDPVRDPVQDKLDNIVNIVISVVLYQHQSPFLLQPHGWNRTRRS